MSVRESHRIGWFTGSLAEFDAEIKWRVTHEPAWTKIRSEVKSIGIFRGRKVVDVLFWTAGSDKPFGKLVLLGHQDQFRPVVWILNDAGVTFKPSQIIHLGKTSILMSRHPVSGTGNFYLEDYFVFDTGKGIPINLGIDAIIAAELKQTLPPGLSVSKGGGLDVATLRYSSAVRNDGDANCYPTGGRIEIHVSVRGNAVAVREAQYYPSSPPQ